MNTLHIVPSAQQQKHEAYEFYGFIHFGMNTFLDQEWSDGSASPMTYAPATIDAAQWVSTLKSAGMKGVILTCKHHDGFCLWPTKTTAYGVQNSGYTMDVVGAVSTACKSQGMGFGVYLSPWDRHEKTYGQGAAYDDFYVRQLTELLTQYGELFAVWLDGACGEGPNGKKQIYDWARYEQVVRTHQPEACLCVCGPDVRWCGNENGDTRPCEWSVVPARLRDAERIQASSQQADDTAFREKKLCSTDLDLGSRAVIEGETDLIWYPAEVNLSIRPGWFYHQSEDAQVKTVDQLWDVYLRSVGGNASLLLNVPPSPLGVIHPNDVAVLKALGKRLRTVFFKCLYHNEMADVQEVCIKLPKAQTLAMLSLGENTAFSQRVEAFDVTLLREEQVVFHHEGTTIGTRCLVELCGQEADQIILRITQTRGLPKMKEIAVYGK